MEDLDPPLPDRVIRGTRGRAHQLLGGKASVLGRRDDDNVRRRTFRQRIAYRLARHALLRGARHDHQCLLRDRNRRIALVASTELELHAAPGRDAIADDARVHERLALSLL